MLHKHDIDDPTVNTGSWTLVHDHVVEMKNQDHTHKVVTGPAYVEVQQPVSEYNRA